MLPQNEPTIKQIEAIKSYEDWYDIKIFYSTKKDCSTIISEFMKNRELYFDKNRIKNTNICFINNSLPSEQKTNMVRTDKKRVNTIDLLSSLNENMSRLQNEVSYSEFEDSLGYLDEEMLGLENDIFGANPLWYK